MPTLFLPTIETTINITRPVVMGVINDLFKMTSIPLDTSISFPGDLEVMQQPGSDISKISQQAGVNTMPYTNRIWIEVDEDYEMDRILSTAIYRTENPYLFLDDRIDVGIRPIYSSTDTTINFKFRSIDKTAAMRWRDYIRTQVSLNIDQRIHNVKYHYLIPIEYLIILKEIHRLMENVDGYGVEFDDYITSFLSKRATVMTTQAGTQAAWAIVESQIRVVGMFDFDLVPEKGAREDESDTWTIAFSYKFKYDKPIACTMKYPLMIHNQLLPQNYRNNPLVDVLNPLDNKKFDFSLSSYLFYQFEKDVQTRKLSSTNEFRGVSIPSYDEWVASSYPYGTLRVFDALINIDEKNPPLLLSLKELGDFNINSDVLSYMATEYKHMCSPGMSVFTVSMYRGNSLLDADALILDEDLNIYSTYRLTLRKYYHIRLSVVKDLTTISSAVIDRLRSHGKAAQIILDYIDPNLSKKNLLPKILANNYISKVEMQNAINAINHNTNRTPSIMSVQSLIIEASPINKLEQEHAIS